MFRDIFFTVLQCLVLFVVHLRSESINVVGKECKVTEPIYNHTFDFSLLHNDLKYTVKLNNKDRVDFNICGDLTPTCNGKSSVTACYSENGKEHVMGVGGIAGGSDPILTDGRIHFNYTGDVCEKNPKTRYNIQIILICDYSNQIKEPITNNEYSEDSCSLHVFLRTRYACLNVEKEIESNKCTVTDPESEHTFDLMALSQYNNRILNSDSTTFVINVCKPVLYGYEDMCPPGSSICLQNNNESNLSKKFVNYGSTVANPTYENGKLFMHFTSMEKCNGTQNISSHINFNCDTSIETGEPEYLGVRNCEHRFVWDTKLACNSVDPCVTVDSRTGNRYDLTSLAGTQYFVVHDNKTYLFGICNMANSPCKGKDGICEKTDTGDTISLGQFNDHLKFNETGSSYLSYVGGDVCVKPSRQWTSKIEFLCPTKEGKEGPIIVENTECQIIIQYMTDLVCQKEINCKAYNSSSDTAIDLSPLISSSGNYLAKVSDSLKSTEGPPVLHYINVCRPLVPQFGLSCPGGTSACRAKNSTTTPTSELSLGFPDISMVVVQSRVHLKYLGGSSCPKEPGTDLSSVIEFYCDPSAGRGTPILQEIMQDCHYRFEWATNVMCPVRLLKFDADNCDVYNDQLNTTVNLKTITDKGIVTVKQESKPFDLDICVNNRKVETDYAQGAVKVFFDGGPCKPDATYSVELRFVCKEAEKRYLPPSLNQQRVVYIIKETSQRRVH